MLFKSILNKKTASVQSEFDRFFLDILKNQTHTGDLLLIDINGYYNPEVKSWRSPDNKMCPYMFGPNKEGHSQFLHHQFIGEYLKKSILEQPYEEYVKQHEYSQERFNEISELQKLEGDSIQYEMLMYLKIWEADLFIKQFYQLVRLSEGLEYDWHFSIWESNRDNDATGKRHEIIRKRIRNKIEKKYPEIYAAIKCAFNTQIRNSIAHSKYSMIGRYIHLNNYIADDDASQIKVVSFDEWVDLMHNTLVIYSQLTRILNCAGEFYRKFQEERKGIMEIRINRKDMVPATEFRMLKYRPEWDDWYWADNED